MYQLRCLFNRTSDSTTNMNTAEDFLLVLLHAFALAAANAILSYNPTDSATELASYIVVNYVSLPAELAHARAISHQTRALKTATHRTRTHKIHQNVRMGCIITELSSCHYH